MIEVKVKFFGPVKDIVQHDELTLAVPPPYDGETAFTILAEAHPRLREWKPSLRLAVNLEYSSLDRVLQSGDEISFIPPVSGG